MVPLLAQAVAEAGSRRQSVINGSSVCLILVKKQRGRFLLSPLFFHKENERRNTADDRIVVNKLPISGIVLVV